MRRNQDFFEQQDVELVYIAKKLSEARALEALLTTAGTDYLVEADHYLGGFVFQQMRVGAFFYVLAGAAEPARQFLEGHGYRPQRAPD